MAFLMITEKHYEAYYPYIPEEYIPLLSQPGTVAIGAVDDETDVASGIIIASMWGNTLHIEWLYVGEQFRQNGIAVALIIYLTCCARDGAQAVRAEFDPENIGLRRLFRRSMFTLRDEARSLYSITLGQMKDHHLFKSVSSSAGAMPLSEVPLHMLREFSFEMEQTSESVELPINPSDYDEQISYVFAHNNKITSCFLLQKSDEGLHISFAYTKNAREIVTLICLATKKAFTIYPDNTPITVATVGKEAEAIMQKMFSTLQPMELCVAMFAF